MKNKGVALLLLSSLCSPALAANSAPQPVPLEQRIPDAQDKPFPGTLQISVDATNTQQGIVRVREVIPVPAAGPLVLLYPQWLPGNHAPRGPIDALAGLKISASGKPLSWKRDTVDVFAFHVDVPAGVTQLDVEFQFLSPTASNQGRIVMTPAMLNLQWNTVALYPVGYYTRQIPAQATVRYPAGWKDATALRPDRRDGDVVTYKVVDFDTLVDSPVFAGLYTRKEQLSDKVALNIVADRPEDLEAKPEQIAKHKALVDQAVKLFGAQHYDHYDFLLALSDRQSGIGLEHHRSSENGVGRGYFTDFDNAIGDRDLLPHEYTHSWDGKFRRGADLWTPDFRTPMRDSLLWVYEGQTQFWGYVLAARSGLWTKQEALDNWALVAASLDNARGRDWRPVADTTNDPIISARRPKGWRSYQRSEDYYVEGAMVWLDADALIRSKTGGKKGMDDFARAFFGINDGDWGEVTYTFDDVVKTLNGIVPYDWATFLHDRIDSIQNRAPTDGITRGGYKLTYTDEPTDTFKKFEKDAKVTNLAYSGGLVVKGDGTVSTVLWDSAAFQAGLTIDDTIVAVDGRAFDADDLKKAIKAAKTGRKPIVLLVKSDVNYRSVALQYYDGLRYPRLEKSGSGTGSLDTLLAAKK
jgi:predicted metalloprotease with PDZ domain